MRLIQFIIFL